MTRDDGSVEMRQLKPGTYSFIALTRDYAPGIARDVSVGGEKDPDAAMVPLAAGGSARILVQNADKTPISGASYAIESSEGPEFATALELLTAMRGGSTATGSDGTVSLEHLPAGKYQVTVTKGDAKLTKSLTVEDGSRADLAFKIE